MGEKKLKRAVPALKHIENEQVKFLAEQAQVKEDYVRKIINGKRAVQSPKAKVIYKAAKALDRAVENWQMRSKREFIIIGEND